MKRAGSILVSFREYCEVLSELGILDDDEDWELYKQQEKKFELDEVGEEFWINLHKARTSL